MPDLDLGEFLLIHVQIGTWPKTGEDSFPGLQNSQGSSPFSGVLFPKF